MNGIMLERPWHLTHTHTWHTHTHTRVGSRFCTHTHGSGRVSTSDFLVFYWLFLGTLTSTHEFHDTLHTHTHTHYDTHTHTHITHTLHTHTLHTHMTHTHTHTHTHTGRVTLFVGTSRVGSHVSHGSGHTHTQWHTWTHTDMTRHIYIYIYITVYTCRLKNGWLHVQRRANEQWYYPSVNVIRVKSDDFFLVTWV